MVEHNLAKVGVASSSLVFRSKENPSDWVLFLCLIRSAVEDEHLKYHHASPLKLDGIDTKKIAYLTTSNLY